MSRMSNTLEKEGGEICEDLGQGNFYKMSYLLLPVYYLI